MTSSINSFIKAVSILFVLQCGLVGFAAELKTSSEARPVQPLLIAVLPVYNLSGVAAPLENIRLSLIGLLRKEGVRILGESELSRSMQKQRLRFVGGVNQNAASYFKADTAADAILITTLEHYDETAPPKIALLTRLVSTDPEPEILWTSGAGLAGDDSPGLLELHLINDPQQLTGRALQRLAGDLSAFLSGVPNPETDERLRPGVSFVSPTLDKNLNYKVAIIPFYNSSSRKFAGEIIGLHFIDGLRSMGNFVVTEPGVVRQRMLRTRVVMHDGISLSDAGALFSLLDVDLILTGNIMDYQDYQGRDGFPVVDFSTQMIERRTRKIVWLSRSVHRGDDGVFFFDWGKVNTAHSLAAAMARGALGSLNP